MQKLITVSVDTKQLLKNTDNPFNINEVDGVNELLEQGWEIEQLEIVKGEAGDGEILFLAVLNDDAMFDDDDEDYDEEFGFNEDDDLDEDEMDEIGDQKAR
ncbi:MAG: hypothetical protein JWP81_725 [Ferruginibacter sp.]|nr:hypothetical protein [Ferruginibacter sp.]